ncbi:MAG TPA: HIT family protein [Pedobacter sp.]|nr:HIT family protein [Pedobacter sp.]
MNDFSAVPDDKILYKDVYFFIIEDAFPVSPGHLLIISNELRQDYFDLLDNEKSHLPIAIEAARNLILHRFQPDGFNIGMNCGEAAGQTVFHFHCHVIPRYIGDMDNPRGGVRHCVDGRGDYKNSYFSTHI